MIAGRGVDGSSSVPDPNSSYIVGPCTCTESMALNGYIKIACFGRNFLIGPLFIAWDSLLLVPVRAGSFIAPCHKTSLGRNSHLKW